MKGFASLMANLLGARAICGQAPVAKDIQLSGRNQQLLGLLKTLDPQKKLPCWRSVRWRFFAPAQPSGPRSLILRRGQTTNDDRLSHYSRGASAVEMNVLLGKRFAGMFRLIDHL
jgi:hypothetical protein